MFEGVGKQSNYTRFIYGSVMMMARNEELTASFRGFLCHAQLLESVGSNIRHIVYADDGFFSDSQLVHRTRAVYVHGADAEQTVLHIDTFRLVSNARASGVRHAHI